MKFQLSAFCATTLFGVNVFVGQEQKKDTSTTKTIHLNEVILNADKKTNPAASFINTQNAKRVVQPKNVADLFENVNGFALIKRGNYAIDPSLRGAQYEQLNIQFNGGTKVMHACPNRMDPITTHVVPEEIQKIEVIKGPYSVRYGATFGGILNLVTRKNIDERQGYHGKLSFGDESNGNSITTMANIDSTKDDFNAAVNFGYRDFGNYEDGDGNEIPASFKSTDYGVQLGYSFNNQRLQLGFRQSFGRDVLHAGLPMDTEEDNSSIASVDYKYEVSSKKLQEINAKAYYSYVDHLMTNTLRPSFSRVAAESAVDATTLGGKLELMWNFLGNHKLCTGLDALHISRDGLRDRIMKQNTMGQNLANPMEFTDKIWQDSRITDYGVFAETDISLSNFLLLKVGARYDLVNAKSNDPADDFLAYYPDLDSRILHNFSGTTTLKYAANENLMVELAFGRGVRSANMIERFINHFTVGQDPFEHVGNPNLKAEVNHQFELGLKGYSVFEGTFLDKWSYSASTYYANYNNYIAPLIDESLSKKYMPAAEPTAVKRFVNIDNAYKTGFELSTGVDFLTNLNVTAEMAYVYTKNQDLDESLPLTPPLTTRFHLAFEKEKLWAKASYVIVSEQDEIAPSFGESVTNGYGLVNLRLGGQPFKHFDVGFAALNLFDVAYNNHLNFSFTNQANFGRVPINDPGRNLSVFVQYSF